MALAICLFCFLAHSVLAQEGLYGDPPPPNAAFVRVIVAVEGKSGSGVSIGKINYDVLSFAEISPYRVILEGTHQLNGDKVKQTLEIKEGKFYTVVLSAEKATLLEDTINTNRAKALLNLYNLGNLETVDLKTADGQTDVLLGVTPMSLKSIEVNGITVDLAVLANGETLTVFENRKLERAAAYSAIVIDSETVIWVQSQAISN